MTRTVSEGKSGEVRYMFTYIARCILDFAHFLRKSLFDLFQYTTRNSCVRCARKGGFFQCSHILLRAF